MRWGSTGSSCRTRACRDPNACMTKGSNPATATLGSGGMQAHAQLPAGQQSGVAWPPLCGTGLAGACECECDVTTDNPAACSWHAACNEGPSPTRDIPSESCCSNGGNDGIDVDASADPLKITLMHNRTRQRTV